MNPVPAAGVRAGVGGPNAAGRGVARACAVGVAEPVAVRGEDFGTGSLDARQLEALVRKHFDLTPRGIDEALKLKRPIYRATSYHGHFGRENAGFPWEETDKADAIRRDL